MLSVEIESSSTSELGTSPNDLDFPITHRKGVRSCTKHLLSKFVSNHSLSPSLEPLHCLFTRIRWKLLHILDGSKIWLKKWRHFKEMRLGNLSLHRETKKLIGYKWVFIVNIKLMGRLKNPKQYWWTNDSHKLMESIIMTHFPLWQRWIISKLFYHVHLILIGTYNSWMWNAFLCGT